MNPQKKCFEELIDSLCRHVNDIENLKQRKSSSNSIEGLLMSLKRMKRHIALSFLCLMISCTGERNSYTLSTDQNLVSDSGNIQNINFYLETSGSMKGYINPNVSGKYPLKDVLPFIVTDVNNTFNLESNLYTISDSQEKYLQLKSTFFKELRSTEIFKGGSSKLQKIFSDIINNSTTGNVNFLITDCIPDLGDINTKTESSIITSKIYKSLLENKSLGVAFFKYNSDFNGTFYFNRKNQGLENRTQRPFYNEVLQKRPFYIWIFGEGGAVNEILSKNIIKDYNAVHSYNLPIQKINVGLIKSLKSGKVAVNENSQTVYIQDATERAPAEFNIGLNLTTHNKLNVDRLLSNSKISVFPNYIRNTTEVDWVTKGDMLSTAKSNNKPIIQSSSYSHFLNMTLTSFNPEVEQIGVTITTKEPKWIRSTHIDEDIGITSDQLENKTFGLKFITDAFSRAYNIDEPALTITLTKGKKN